MYGVSRDANMSDRRGSLMELVFMPKSFREVVEADLQRAARLIVKIQDEIDPQFRVATPEGDFWLAVTLPTDDNARRVMMDRIGLFMAWKQAAAFTLASELTAPDCVFAAGVSFTQAYACLAPIDRQPRPWNAASFGAVEWLPPQSIGQDLIGLLPRGTRTITAQDVQMLETWFGRNGRFPAVHVPSGEVRGIAK